MASFPAFSSEITYSGKLSAPAPRDRNNTDILKVDVKLYIEGVQVPFESISISQTYNEYPSAVVQIPPASGLLDIIRGYQPKVHIFYDDLNTGGDRLLFWGHITDVNYSKDRGSATSSVTFQCSHKNRFLSGFTLDYTGWSSEVSESYTDPNSATGGAGVKPAAFNSSQMIIQSLVGINGVATDDEVFSKKNSVDKMKAAGTDKLDPSLNDLKPRLTGMVGLAVNLWNQIKKGGYTSPLNNIALTKMWIPLIDEGLSFFKRTSGHTMLEDKLQDSKQPFCHENTTKEFNILVPPFVRTSMISAVQREATVNSISSIARFSGELTTFPSLLRQFYSTVKYDMLTLASPAELPVNPLVFAEADDSMDDLPRCAIETIIKPQMPHYYSPTCNVVMPRMFSSITLTQQESTVPTRVNAYCTPAAAPTSRVGLNFRAPASIREATALNVQLKGLNPALNGTLNSTLGSSYAIPGKYEQGQGILPKRIQLPGWLSLLVSKKEASNAPDSEAFPNVGTPEYQSMMLKAYEWDVRYSYDIIMSDGDITPSKTLNTFKHNLNPYHPKSPGLKAYHRMMFGAVEDDFAMSVAASRNGRIDMVFNPYIVPGYPMDIIDDSPNHPSFHGLCTSVTHNISSRSISTTVGAAALTSYAELSNYYMPAVAPFLEQALNMINGDVDQDKLNANAAGSTDPFSNTRSTLLQNPKAKETADTFYRQVLGVGAAAPDDLIHFASNRAYPVSRQAGILIPKISPEQAAIPDLRRVPSTDGRESDDYYSTVGNLRLVRRNIESKEAIKSKFAINFIDLTPVMYNSSYVNYLNPKLAKDLLLEPGASLFLDYMETSEFIKDE